MSPTRTCAMAGVNYPHVRYGGVTYGVGAVTPPVYATVRDGQLEGLRWRISYSNTVE